MNDIMNNALSAIPVPQSVRARVAAGVRAAKKRRRYSAALATAAAFVLCIAALNDSTIADTARGFFRDIKSRTGAVTGTEYLAAAGEIEISARIISKDILSVNISIPGAGSYIFMETLRPGAAELTDTDGNVLYIFDELPGAVDKNGKCEFEIPLTVVSQADKAGYMLIIHDLVASSKADKDMRILGEWNCEIIPE